MSAPRYAQRPDSNQPEIVSALEKIGCSVYDMSKVGGGLPDLLIGYRGCCLLLEVKGPKGKLRPSQKAFRDSWNGHFAVVRSSQDAIDEVMRYVTNHPIR